MLMHMYCNIDMTLRNSNNGHGKTRRKKRKDYLSSLTTTNNAMFETSGNINM